MVPVVTGSCRDPGVGGFGEGVGYPAAEAYHRQVPSPLILGLSTALVVAACSGSDPARPACVGFAELECAKAAAEAAAVLPGDANEGVLVEVSVSRIDPTDPSLCEDYGACEPIISAAFVDLGYHGFPVPERWSLAAVTYAGDEKFTGLLPLAEAE
jgi:hypothetical protein